MHEIYHLFYNKLFWTVEYDEILIVKHIMLYCVWGYIKTNSFEHTVCKRNQPATNLPGRPPQHQQISCILIASGNNY